MITRQEAEYDGHYWRYQDIASSIGACGRLERPMILSSTTRKHGERGCPAPFPCTPNPRRVASASLRTISLDDSEHLRHNHRVSVASLRLLFTFAPECRSASGAK